MRKFIIIFLLAVLLRSFFAFEYPQTRGGDSSAYDAAGINFSQGKGFIKNVIPSSGMRSPGYPFFLAFIYKTLGYSHSYVKFFQIILGLFTMAIIWFLSKNILGNKTAFIAVLLAAIYPPFLAFSALILTESLFTFCIILFVYLLYMGFIRESRYYFFFAGVIAGYTALVREEFLFVIILYFSYIFFHCKEKFNSYLIIIFMAFFIISPWTIRNYLVLKEFVFISSQGANAFWISSYKEEWLDWRSHSEDPYLKEITKGLKGRELDKMFRREAINNIKEHPLLYVKFSFKRLGRFWIGSHSNKFSGLENSLTNYFSKKDYGKVLIKLSLLFFNTTIIFAGFYGIFLALKQLKDRRKEIILLLIPVIAIMTVHFFLFATVRYQLPIMPFMIIFASYALRYCYDELLYKKFLR